MRPLLAIAFLLLLGTPLQAQTFTLGGVSNCGPNHSNGITYELPAGTQVVEWVSGAYSLWSANSFNGGLTWVAKARAYVHATAEVLTFGSPDGQTFFATRALAEATAVGLHALDIATASAVTFYLSDGGGCGDNRGSITLRLVAPLPTESDAWGGIKALYRAGR